MVQTTLKRRQIDPDSTTEISTVATEVAQLALSASEGDVAVRSDESKTYMHNGGTAGTMADWTELLSPGDVTSVFTRTGAVTAQTNDYTWAQIDKTTSSIADITTRSHTDLTDKGTNTHAQIDTHLGAANPHSGSLSTTLTDGNIFVGNGSNVATGVTMSSEASITNTGAVTLSNAAVIGKVLTGFTSGAGTVTATDSILQAIQKLDGNINNENLWDRSATNLLPATAGDDIGATGTRINKIWATDLELDNLPTISGTSIGDTLTVENDFTITNTAGSIMTSDAQRRVQFFDGQLNAAAPGALTAHANFNTAADADLNIAGGTSTGTLNGSATVSGGRLNLNNDNSAYVTYSGTSNFDSQQVGCCRVGIRPAYSGNPSSNQTFYTVVDDTTGSALNLIRVRHLTTGNIQVRCSNSAGTLFINDVLLGTFNPTSGQLYDFEFNYDFTTGATRLFIDGTQLGSTITSTGTRSSTIGIAIFGDSPGLDQTANFQIDYMSFYNAVQHTTNFTPDSGEFDEDQIGFGFQLSDRTGWITSASGHGMTESEHGVVSTVRDTANGVARVFGYTQNFLEVFPNKTVKLQDGATRSPLNITERSAAPTSPQTNDIYLDDGTNTGSGNPGWRRYTGSAWEDITAGVGTPGGADTQVQFNDGGSTFGGDAELTYNKTTNLLTLGGNVDFTAGAHTIGASVGANNLTIAGSTSTVIIPGNLTVQGTTTQVDTTNMQVKDKNILINDGGTTAGTVGAGLDIEGDGAAVVGYVRVASGDNANFELKAPGNASVLTLDINATETLTVAGSLNVEADSAINQDLTSDASPTFVNQSLTGYQDFSEITTPANPSANVGRTYVKDDGGTTKLYFRDSAGTETDLLAGGGSSTFIGLTDTPGSYTTANALITNNGTPNALIEVGTKLTEGTEIMTFNKDSRYIQVNNSKVLIGYGTTGGSANSIGIGANVNAANTGDVCIGANSTTSGGSAVAVGSSAQCTGTQTTALGNTARAQASYSCCFGTSTQVTSGDDFGLALGFNCKVNHKNSVSKGAYTTSLRTQEDRWSIPSSSLQNKRASSTMIAYGETTSSTQTEIYLGNESGERIAITSNSVLSFKIQITAKDSTSGDCAVYHRSGCIKNIAGTTSLVGSVQDDLTTEQDATWDVAVEADDTNDALVIKVTGDATNTVKWIARIDTVEVAD